MLLTNRNSIFQPFWPTGSGAGRGVLSALDCAWMIKQFCSNHPPLACVRERENIYKLLSGTTNDTLQKNHKLFTIDPKTRYTAFDSKKVSNISSLHSLYDTDDKENADFSVLSPQQKEKETTIVKRCRRSSSGGMILLKLIRFSKIILSKNMLKCLGATFGLRFDFFRF